MGAIASLLDAGQDASGEVRNFLSRNRTLARARIGARAMRLGRSVRWEDGSSGPVVVYDDTIALRVAGRLTSHVWEAVNYLPDWHELALPTEQWQGPDGVVRPLLDISGRRAHTLRKSRQSFVFTSIPESDSTNELYLELARLPVGGVAFDCGAYCGASACVFAEAVGPSGRVIAFEPDDDNWSALTENLGQRAWSNITTIKKGIWKSSTTLTFENSGDMGSHIDEHATSSRPTTTIETISLQDAYDSLKLDRLDFIKMDIEGAEIASLEAARELLRARGTRVVVEAHYVDGELATQRLVNLFEQIGFMTIVVLESLASPYHLVHAYPRQKR